METAVLPPGKPFWAGSGEVGRATGPLLPQVGSTEPYEADPHCVAHPQLGGTGQHWVNQAPVDPSFDPLAPEVRLSGPELRVAGEADQPLPVHPRLHPAEKRKPSPWNTSREEGFVLPAAGRTGVFQEPSTCGRIGSSVVPSHAEWTSAQGTPQLRGHSSGGRHPLHRRDGLLIPTRGHLRSVPPGDLVSEGDDSGGLTPSTTRPSTERGLSIAQHGPECQEKKSEGGSAARRASLGVIFRGPVQRRGRVRTVPVFPLERRHAEHPPRCQSRYP
jgi:hypothetical protein